MKTHHIRSEKNRILALDVALFLIIGIAILALGSLFLRLRNNYDPDNNPTGTILPGMYSSNTPRPKISPTLSASPTPVVSTAENSRSISVGFTSQAPYAVWDEIHEESCEEASVIMAYAWIKNMKLTPEFAEAEIQRLTKWGLDKFNTYDTSIERTALMAKENYGVDSRIIKNPTIDEIKSEINRGNIIIMGMAGRMLENPYFKSPGPVYHMFVIKGYDATGFITNDPGTRRGNGFHYSYKNLMDSSRDWDDSADALSDFSSPAIVVSKNQ